MTLGHGEVIGSLNSVGVWLLIHALDTCCQIIHINTLRRRQNGRRFADDICKCIFLNENVLIPIKISLKFVPKGPINNNPALVRIMARRWPGYEPLSETMMVSLLTHICVTQPQWVKTITLILSYLSKMFDITCAVVDKYQLLWTGIIWNDTVLLQMRTVTSRYMGHG